MDLARRASMMRGKFKEPHDAWPLDGVAIESEFRVKANPVPRDGTTTYYTGVVGLRLKDGGGIRFRCVDEACTLMYATASGAAQHRGFRHPSPNALLRRARINAELIEAGLEPIDFEPPPVGAPEPEPDAEGLFDYKAPALSGAIVVPTARRRGRPPKQPRSIEDTLDLMGPEVAETAKTSIDYLIESRNANRAAYLETIKELERVTKERDHLLEIFGKFRAMTLGIEQMQIGGTDNGQED
jgi:hypothetical protein